MKKNSIVQNMGKSIQYKIPEKAIKTIEKMKKKIYLLFAIQSILISHLTH